MTEYKKLDVTIPRRLEVDPPANIGPSKFPSAVDQLKVIEYSSVPAGGQLERDLREYYLLVSSVAGNTASEQDLVRLKEIMLRVRNYVLTEDDFNLMADAVRTTQSYLKAALDAADGNFELVSSVAQKLVDQINDWSSWLEGELANIATNKNWGAPVIYSEQSPNPSALGYLWLNTYLGDDYVAPAMFWNQEKDGPQHFIDNNLMK